MWCALTAAPCTAVYLHLFLFFFLGSGVIACVIQKHVSNLCQSAACQPYDVCVRVRSMWCALTAAPCTAVYLHLFLCQSLFFLFFRGGGGGLLLVSSKSMSVICVRVSLVNHTTCACQDRDEAIWSQRLIPSVRVYFFVGNGHGHWGGLVCVVWLLYSRLYFSRIFFYCLYFYVY